MHIRINNTNPIPVIKKEIILLNDIYFQLVPYPDGKLEMFNLGQASAQDKRKEGEVITKYSFEKTDKQITIGRDSRCTVAFTNDKSFSKINSILIYDSDKNTWTLKDGDGERSSTNGTWLYASHSYEIHDNTQFIFGTSTFLIKIRI
jgi:hypothetical protein